MIWRSRILDYIVLQCVRLYSKEHASGVQAWINLEEDWCGPQRFTYLQMLTLNPVKTGITYRKW